MFVRDQSLAGLAPSDVRDWPGAQSLAPLEAEPYRLWSLLDIMERFYAEMFCQFSFGLGAFSILAADHPTLQAGASEVVDEKWKGAVKDRIGKLRSWLDPDFPMSLKYIDESFLPGLDHPNLTLGGVNLFNVTLERRIRDELSLKLFLSVPVGRADFYEKPLADWQDVIERFACSYDVEEARKCFALARYTAAVFHLMKVVEAAVLELQVFLEEPPDVKAHFGSVITKLERLTQQTKWTHLPDRLKPYRAFMEGTLTQLHAVKDSWRDKATHVGVLAPTGTFTEEIAKGVHDATLLLMKKLTAGLPPKESD